MSYKLSKIAKYMLEQAGADEVGGDYVSFNTVVIPLPPKVCKELNERARNEGNDPPNDWQP